MKTSNIIKKTLSNNEVIEKKFGLSNSYLQLKVAFSLIKWLIIFTLLFLIIYFFSSNWQEFLTTQISNSNFSTGAKDFDFNSLDPSLSASNLNLNLVFIALLSAYIFIILPAVLFYNLHYLKISNEFIFTNKRLIVKRGWLNTSLVSINFNRITDVSIEQSLVDRFLKIGTLSVSTAGNEGYRVTLSHIKEPHFLKRQLHDLKESYRQTLQINDQLDDLHHSPE